MAAQSIHQNSKRKDAAFIAVNCGATAEWPRESELFGARKAHSPARLRRCANGKLKWTTAGHWSSMKWAISPCRDRPDSRRPLSLLEALLRIHVLWRQVRGMEKE